MLAGFHHDMKSYMQIYEYISTHTQYICCLCVMVLSWFCAIFTIPVTHRTYWQNSLQSTQQNIGSEQISPLALLKLLHCWYVNSWEFSILSFSSCRPPLAVAWQLSYLLQHIQNIINSFFFFYICMFGRHFYAKQLTVCYLEIELMTLTLAVNQLQNSQLAANKK